MYLRDNPSLNIPLPAGLAPLCPWIDLTPSDPTTFLHDEFDSDWLGRGPGIFTTAYFGSKGEKVATERYCSPLHDTSGDAMPPILVSLGTVDRCYGQDLAFFCARPAGSGELQVDIYQDQTHVFQFFTGLQQTQICFSRVAAFVKSDPSAHKTAYNWIAYDGTVSPLPGGKEKMRADLAKLLERVEKDEDWKAQKGKEMGPYLRAVGRA
jgi:acetyl esterase/lipase